MMFCLCLLCGALSYAKTAAKRPQSPRGDEPSDYIQRGIAKQQGSKCPQFTASGDATSEPKRKKPWWLGASSWQENKHEDKPKRSRSSKNKKQKLPDGVLLVKPYSPPPPPPNRPAPTDQSPRPVTRLGVARCRTPPFVTHPKGTILVKKYNPQQPAANNSSVSTNQSSRPITRRGGAKGRVPASVIHCKTSTCAQQPQRPARLKKTHQLPPLVLTSAARERLVSKGFMNPNQEVKIIERPGGVSFDVNFSGKVQTRPSTAKRLEQRRKRKSKKQLEEEIRIAMQRKEERLQAIQEKMRDLSTRNCSGNQAKEKDNISDEFWFPDK